jgi:hypothetical protein
MNLPSVNRNHLNLHFLLRSTEAGQIVASVAEITDCQVIAATKEEAIAQLQAMVRDHMAQIEVVSFEFPLDSRAERENPWLEFIGMYEGDADFAEIAAELRAERGLSDLGKNA